MMSLNLDWTLRGSSEAVRASLWVFLRYDVAVFFTAAVDIDEVESCAASRNVRVLKGIYPTGGGSQGPS